MPVRGLVQEPDRRELVVYRGGPGESAMQKQLSFHFRSLLILSDPDLVEREVLIRLELGLGLCIPRRYMRRIRNR